MIVKVLSSYNGAAKRACEAIITETGHTVWQPGHFYVDLLICPDYEQILSPDELDEPEIGALIFHPSPLPRMKGRNAIKRQYKAGDKVGGGTWFWADNGIDSGDICEQEIVLIDQNEPPRQYYENKIIPIMSGSLKRAISGIEKGTPRRIKQRT